MNRLLTVGKGYCDFCFWSIVIRS